MKYEDLSFEMVNNDGIEVQCDILSVIPDEDKTYIVFTDYKLDNQDNFILQYGQIVKSGETEGFVKITDEKTIKKIKKLLGDFSIGYVNRQVQQNLE